MKRERPLMLPPGSGRIISKRLGDKRVIGAWWTLVMAAWGNGGSLPDDDAKLAAHSHASLDEWLRVKTKVLAEFHKDEDGSLTPNFCAGQFLLVKTQGLEIDDDDYEQKVQEGRIAQ